MIRVAIAGCHRQVLRKPTSHNFAAAFCANPDAEVVGVFDYGERECAEFVECWRDVWGEVPVFDDYEQLLKEVGPDIVCVATRQTMHADQIERAVAAGVRGILSDKRWPRPSPKWIASSRPVRRSPLPSPWTGAGTPPIGAKLGHRWRPESARRPAWWHTASRIQSITAVTGTTPCSRCWEIRARMGQRLCRSRRLCR